jgi:hypothetical protein
VRVKGERVKDYDVRVMVGGSEALPLTSMSSSSLSNSSWICSSGSKGPTVYIHIFEIRVNNCDQFIHTSAHIHNLFKRTYKYSYTYISYEF